MPPLEDGAPDFRRGVVAARGCGGDVVIWDLVVRGVEGVVAGGGGGVFPFFLAVGVRWVVLPQSGLWEACLSSFVGVCAGIVC